MHSLHATKVFHKAKASISVAEEGQPKFSLTPNVIPTTIYTAEQSKKSTPEIKKATAKKRRDK